MRALATAWTPVLVSWLSYRRSTVSKVKFDHGLFDTFRSLALLATFFTTWTVILATFLAWFLTTWTLITLLKTTTRRAFILFIQLTLFITAKWNLDFFDDGNGFLVAGSLRIQRLFCALGKSCPSLRLLGAT
jgi:hypothetical protein